MLKKWNDLPSFMRNDEVKRYWEILYKKRGQLRIKRVFDLSVAILLLVILVIPMVIISIWIKIDSKGPIFYRQERVTKYGKIFKIHKFRTMVSNADKIGSAVTVGNDCRITKVGKILRHFRLDELPQLIDVINGNMSFVGTRPEVIKYVKKYKNEYYATLLLPAGITSKASIEYKDEDSLLKSTDKVDEIYLTVIMPRKMKINLESIKCFSIFSELKIMIKTVFAVLDK